MSPNLSQKQARKIREECLKSLKQALKQKEGVQVIHKYYINLPTEEAHHKCHPTKGIMGLSQRVHPELVAKIQELVHAGTTDPVEIQRLLKHHVHHYMCTGNLPNPTDRAYYPTLDDIRNHVSKAKRAMQLSVIDQENAVKKIAQWSELSPSSHYFFRPYKEANSTMESPSDSNVESCDDSQESLLWVHQEPWQQQLMLKYGNIISLMDATYKTTQYDLPLFFISVHTNTGYCVVAEFIVQSESCDYIKEALQILKTWNPDWHPKFFMTDYSEAEIGALEASFPGTTVYLCDFHREQAWERWVRDKKHGLSSEDAEWLLDQLRACAWAPSADPSAKEPQDYHFKQATDALKHSNLWKKNEHVRAWLSNTWLNTSEVGCLIRCSSWKYKYADLCCTYCRTGHFPAMVKLRAFCSYVHDL